MRLDIVNGTIVTGDGETVLERTSVIVEDGFIADLPPVPYIGYNAHSDRVIDAKGGLVLPGLINMHAHGVSLGPFFPYGWRRLSTEKVLANLDTHLLQGTTTILNGDGLALPFEVETVNKLHPVNVKTCTLHTPGNIRAAEVAAGDGVEARHREFTAAEAVAQGAVALGEVGSPATSYGTAEKGARLGRAISAQHALALDNAVFAEDDAGILRALAAAGIEMTVDAAKQLVEETSVKPVAAARDAIEETVDQVRGLGVPALVHAEPSTRDPLLLAARELGPGLIAVHVNHTFSVDESLGVARELKASGSVVEIISADMFGAKQIESTPDVTFALLKEGLVDVITTDFSGGYHDPMPLVLQKAIEAGVVTLPRAVQLATSAPASIIPRVAPHRGLVEPGKIADVCIVDRDDLSKVRSVVIGGRVVVEEGAVVQGWRRI